MECRTVAELIDALQQLANDAGINEEDFELVHTLIVSGPDDAGFAEVST